MLPHGLVSLWDMMNFNLVDLIHGLWMLDFYEKTAVLPAAPKPGLLGGIAGHISDVDKGNGRTIVEEVGKLVGSVNQFERN
jgi:hypothetical protein